MVGEVASFMFNDRDGRAPEYAVSQKLKDNFGIRRWYLVGVSVSCHSNCQHSITYFCQVLHHQLRWLTKSTSFICTSILGSWDNCYLTQPSAAGEITNKQNHRNVKLFRKPWVNPSSVIFSNSNNIYVLYIINLHLFSTPIPHSNCGPRNTMSNNVQR